MSAPITMREYDYGDYKIMKFTREEREKLMGLLYGKDPGHDCPDLVKRGLVSKANRLTEDGVLQAQRLVSGGGRKRLQSDALAAKMSFVYSAEKTLALEAAAEEAGLSISSYIRERVMKALETRKRVAGKDLEGDGPTIGWSLSADDKERLKKRCKQLGISMSAFVRAVI